MRERGVAQNLIAGKSPSTLTRRGKMQPAIPLLFLLLSLSVQGRKDGSLYDVLGVSRDANQKEIRSAYKRLARQWHPDKNKSPEAQEKILEINKAYEVSPAPNYKPINQSHYSMALLVF